MRKVTLLSALATLFIFSSSNAMANRPAYMGWAQEAHPDYSSDVFLKHLQEQKSYGANLVWIGHNNPGYVDKNKVEPGLSYAVYEAILDQKSPHHADALEQAAAVRRLLEAARQEGMKAVLAIGYQIQMGPDWNARHPAALRRQHDGPLFMAGGPSASYLSPDYQRDIQAYYKWVDKVWVIPFRETLLMLNLADEPHGGDYSASAEAAFKAETGLSWKEAEKSEEGQLKKGHFQNLYIARYAQWSAMLWQKIDPAIQTTMSFCGSHGRFTNFEPSIAAVFSETPSNFDITFDAFLIDNQPGDPITGKHVAALAMFLRQVGALSQKYNKRVWLWPEANNWILSQWSPVKGNISDALFGVKLLRDMSAAAGIHLGGLAVWNLDVKEQGLFRDTHPLIYDPQRMFDKISTDFKTEAEPLLLRRDVLVWIPESEGDFQIGRKSYDYADRVFVLDLYGPLLEYGLIPNLTSDPIPDLHQVQTLFVLGRYAPRLRPEAAQNIAQWVAGGGTLISNYPLLMPSSSVGRVLTWGQFYVHALYASLRQTSRSVTLPLEKGNQVWVLGRLNERGRNILRDIPAAVVERYSPGKNEWPIRAGTASGLLAFPYSDQWVFYNTNPEPIILTRLKPVRLEIVYPDGTRIPLKPTDTSFVLQHGSWLTAGRL